MPNEKLLKLSIALVIVLSLLILSGCASNKAREDANNYLCTQAQIKPAGYEYDACLRRTWSPSDDKRKAYCSDEAMKSACSYKGDL